MKQKICAMCKEEKDISEFRYIAYDNAYYSYCKTCSNAYMREYNRIYKKTHRERKKRKKAKKVLCNI